MDIRYYEAGTFEKSDEVRLNVMCPRCAQQEIKDRMARGEDFSRSAVVRVHSADLGPDALLPYKRAAALAWALIQLHRMGCISHDLFIVTVTPKEEAE